MYKSKSWTLGSFRGESRGKEILVYRQPSDSSNNSSSMYEWQYQINVDDQQGPKSNSYINQTVLIKGFKMTRQKGAFPIVEWAEGTEWWFARALAKLCSIMLRQRWLTRTSGLCSHVMDHLSLRSLYSHRLHPIPEFLSGPYHCSDYCT